MLNYILLAFVKIFDNVISTAKTLTTCNGKKILSSILIFISQILFYTVVKQVLLDDSILAIIIVSGASAIGNYLAFPILDKFKRDDTWENILTSSDRDMIIHLATTLKNNNVKYLLYDTYNRRNEKSLTIMVFTKSKDESKIIDNFLKSTSSKYLRMINGKEVHR